MVCSTARISPSVFRYVCAMRSTSASRRIIGDEVARDFERKMMRRVGIARQHLEHFFAVLHPAGINLVAQHHLRLSDRASRSSNQNSRIAPRLCDGPAGEAARHFDHVLLRVAAVDAERVQLHQLAAVIFVQAALLLLACFGVGVGRAANAEAAPKRPAQIGAIARRCRLFLLQARPSLRDRRSASYRGKRASPGLFAVASSRSRNLPMACGRMASRS